MPFAVGTTALVEGDPNAALDLLFLHGRGENHAKGLDMVRLRAPFRNAEATRLFRIIAPQLATEAQLWGDRLSEVFELCKGLAPAAGTGKRPLFVVGFSIGGAGTVDLANVAAANGFAVAAWCAVDAARPPAIEGAGLVPHLIIDGPMGYRSAESISVACPPNIDSKHYHGWVAQHAMQDGAPLAPGGNSIYAWFAGIVAARAARTPAV
jgi:hypothetical protein